MNKNFDATATPTTGLTFSVKGACKRKLAFICMAHRIGAVLLMDLGPPGIFEMNACLLRIEIFLCFCERAVLGWFRVRRRVQLEARV